MARFLESAMLVLFGLSWPMNIVKSVRSGTARGKSVWFEVLILTGYLCGLTGKLLSGDWSYVVVFYALDILMVSADLTLTLRNRRRDRAAE